MMENKILVVDDEDFHRELMQKLLCKLGYDVAVVESAEAAFSHLAKEKVSIIITDLIMLEMDGVEFCQKIRETDNIILPNLSKSRSSRKRFKRASRSSAGERKSRIKDFNSRSAAPNLIPQKSR